MKTATMNKGSRQVAGRRPRLLPGIGALGRCRVVGPDEPIGRLRDLYFDDQSWTVRYLVVDRPPWPSFRRILVSPISVVDIDVDRRRITTGLTRMQAEGCPSVEDDRPVSRQHEIDLAVYLGFPFYWRGGRRWGTAEAPADLRGGQPPPHAEHVLDLALGDPHLRSMRALHGYAIQATDAEVGHVTDFLLESDTGAMRYVVVGLHNWWPGSHRLIAVDWVVRVSWEGKLVQVDVSSVATREAPAYRGAQSIDRAWEARLAAHYRRPGYWAGTAAERRPGVR